MKKIVVVDGNSVVYMSYYALSGTGLKNKLGVPTNAIYNFIIFLNKLIEQTSADMIVFTFDIGKPHSRLEKYEEYKAGRKPMPDDLRQQFPIIKKYLNIVNIPYFELDGAEADDIIATIAEVTKEKHKVEIYSRDKDLLQLVDKNVDVHMLKKGLSEIDTYTVENFKEKTNLNPEQIIDLKALSGDLSDNIKGVPGVGAKTAEKWILKYKSVENLYNNISDLPQKQQEKLMAEKENVLIYKEIVKLNQNVEIQLDTENLNYKEPNKDRQLEFFEQYDMHRFTKSALKESSKIQNSNYTTSEDISLLKSFTSVVGLHVETFGANYHKDIILGVGITSGEQSLYIPWEEKNISILKSFLESNDIEKICHDYKKQKVVLSHYNIELKNCIFDTLIGNYLLDPDRAKSDLALVANRIKLYNLKLDEEVYGKGTSRAIPSEHEILKEHIVSKSQAIALLYLEIKKQLSETNMLQLYEEIEHPLMDVLVSMELEGVKIDVEYLKILKEEFSKMISDYTENIYGFAGSEFNISSPQQLGKILFEDLGLPVGKKTKTGKYSTNAEVLLKLKDKHPIINDVIGYRQISKLQSTYVEGLLALQEDSIIHTIFNQAETATGRLSSIEPNLQNIPIREEVGRRIRKAFISKSNDSILFAADYSQIELRILAHLASNEVLINAFNNNVDIHAETASKVFDIPFEAVTPKQRSQAKAVNFGIIYGMSKYGLSQELGISIKEADEFIKKYFETFEGIKKYQEELLNQATYEGYISTILNRRRYLPELGSSNFQRRELARRMAVNAPIQGSSQDIIKKAMVEVFNFLNKNNLKSKLLIQVHDELVLDVPKEELEIIKSEIPKIMEKTIKLSVPVKVDSSFGDNWFEAK